MKKTRSQKIRSKKTNKTKKIIMFKNRPLNKSIPALMLTITLFTLLWGCTSGAMFDSFKKNISQCYAYAASYLNSKQSDIPQPIKPFSSDEEKKKAFRALKISEDLQPCIVDYDENYCISKTIQDIEEVEHKGDVIAFIERLARDVVKHDIENKEPYTIALGLKLEADGTISMQQSPCSDVSSAISQNELLFRLSINPKDTGARKKLKELYQKNRNLSQKSDKLFPAFVLLSKAKMGERASADTTAGYQKSSNSVYLREGNLEDICNLTQTVLHELTHFRQWLHGTDGLGGLEIGVMTPKYNSPNIPHEVACELDAEKQSIDLYPAKELYAKRLEKNIKKNGEIIETVDLLKRFPYFSNGHCYRKICKHLGCTGKPACIDITRESEELRKGIMIILKKGLGKNLYHILETYAKLAQNQYKFDAGSKEFFDIKCKILKELDEENQRALTKKPFPMSFSVDFSKKFENKN